MSKHHVFSLFAVVVLVALIAAACAPQAPTTTAPEGPAATAAPVSPADVKGTVKFYKGPFGPDEMAQQNGYIAEFNKVYPNVKMTFETFDWPTQEAQLTAAIAGCTHNMIYVPEGMYPKFCYKGGPLTDLSSYVNDPSFKETKDNILYWDVATSPDGVLCGVPNVWIPESHYVANLDMLKAAGCPDDWDSSMDKVRECAIAIKTKFPENYGIAFRTAGLANFSQHDWYGYILRAGGNYLTKDFQACGLNTPEVVQTLQWLVDLQNKDKVTPEFGAYTWDGLRGLFQGGKLGIMHDEPPIAGVLASNPPGFEYKFFGIPGLKNNNLITFRGFYVIPECSKDKEAAFEAIKFWVQQEVMVNYLNGTAGLYPVAKDTHGIPVFPNDPVLADGMNLAQYAEGPQFHPQMLEFQNLFQHLFDEMMQGNITPQEAVDQACEQIEAKLKK